MDDVFLVDRARRGDEDAFARLVDRYRDPVFAFVRQRVRDRAAAEDVAQEVFVTAYLRLETLAEPAQLAGWLFGIARNLALKAARTAGRDRIGRIGEEEALQALAARAPLAPEIQGVEDRDLGEAVRRAIGALDDPYRAALTLRFREGLSYRDVAQALGLAVGTVSSLIHRGLGLLAPRLAPLGRCVVGEVETDAALAEIFRRRGEDKGGIAS